MPNYYNPYNFYPVTYQSPVGYSGMTYPQMQQPVQQQSYSNGPKAMEWVEGEVGAKAFQMPQGWPANQPIPLWDSTDTVIYLKSWSPMGFPNPIQKIHYTMSEQNQMMLPQGQSGEGNISGAAHDMSQYVTKEDLNQMKQELRNMLNTGNNQNGSNNGQRNDLNRGGNK